MASVYRAALTIAFLLPPSLALAHPVLHVEPLTDGTVSVSCGPETTPEGVCTTDADCTGKVPPHTCFDLQTTDGRSLCLGTDDVFCCFGDRAGNDECPIVEGYDATCVPLTSVEGIQVIGAAFVCVYDVAGTHECADRAAQDPTVALACQTVGEGASLTPVFTIVGDCDRDGLANVADDQPCTPVEMRFDGGAHVEIPLNFRGGGGAVCAVGVPHSQSWWPALVLLVLLFARRRAWIV